MSEHGSTLFVSNLPYTATSTDIQTLFSEIAPVRSAFVVLDKESKSSKGVAYVSFAIKEDAALALENDKPLELDGRVLRLQWADRKGMPHHSEKPATKKPKKLPRPKTSSDPDAIRTVVVSNLPDGIDSKSLWKKARKIPGASKVVFPAPTAENDTHTALVKFASPAEASAAVSKLHNHIFKGSQLSATIKKRVDKLVAGRKSGAPSHSSRLIVRNLAWHVTEQDLHKAFAPYGPIYSITLPTDESSGRHRGFAFVWMLSRADAERALESVNGRVIGAQKKHKKTRKEREEAARARAATRLRAMKDGQESEEEQGESEEEHVDGQLKEGRVVAVDWALSKSKWEEAVSQRQSEEATKVDEEESGEKGSDEEGSDEETESESDASGDEGSAEESEEEIHERPQLPTTDVGTTLFVRNVPFEATEDDLRTLFRSFGPLRYARITLDKETGRSRGTGFVCFWKKEDANAAIDEAETMARELGTDKLGSGDTKVHNPFSMSLLTPDPSASLAKRLVLHGRTLSVARAVTRGEADRLREEGERSREKQDKRNLYLMREGGEYYTNALDAAAGLSEAELAARQASYDSRRALLRSNPSLYVSRTRISVRRLPLWVSERVLKRLAIHAIQEFEAEVSRGERDPLTRDELQLQDTNESTPNRKRGIQQAKIVRATDRVDGVTGKGRSRGYGFIETSQHADALRVLRWANNRPGVVGLMRQWWRDEVKDLIAASSQNQRLKEELGRLDAEVGSESRGLNKTLIMEFAIENVQVVKRRREQAEAARADQIEGGARKRKAEQTVDEPTRQSKKSRKDDEVTTADKRRKPKFKGQTQKGATKVSIKSGTANITRGRRDKRKMRRK